MRDHLSWKTTYLCQKDLSIFQYNWTCHQRPLSCLERSDFVANGMVFQDRLDCISTYSNKIQQWTLLCMPHVWHHLHVLKTRHIKISFTKFLITIDIKLAITIDLKLAASVLPEYFNRIFCCCIKYTSKLNWDKIPGTIIPIYVKIYLFNVFLLPNFIQLAFWTNLIVSHTVSIHYAALIAIFWPWIQKLNLQPT